MKTLPPALQALAAYPQFLNYRLVPKENGRTDKLPVNPRTGHTCDAHDPAIWVTVEEAFATGMPVAYVFTDRDPFFFIDIDDCLTDEQKWSPTAVEICKTFGGCAIEVSQSNAGLHIFGVVPSGDFPHRSDNKDIGTQFYTTKRFVALTGRGTVGDAGYVMNAETYGAWVATYFKPKMGAPGGLPANWSETPCPDWDGPEDDKLLIKQMLKAKSARGILGMAATVRQLWDADEEALGKAYPDTLGGKNRAFDWSVADAALCSHLAFWTGKNCERMDRLFRMSALSRDKWLQREKYRETTIQRAIEGCKQVYRQRKVKPGPPAPVSGATPGFQYCTLQDQANLFQGCCYVRDIHKIFVPDTGELLKPEQFRAVFGGHVFTLDLIGDKTTRNAWEVFTESQATKFPRAHSTCFRPELAPGEVVDWEGLKYVNTYVPVQTSRIKGDPSPFINLLKRMLPNPRDRKILLSYMAACVQYPGTKFQWAPLLQGIEGNGKTFIGTCLTHAIGERYTHSLDTKDIGNIFNSWISRKLLIIVEDVQTQGSTDAIKTLGWLIANRRIPIQGKGLNQVTGDNRANFLMSANPKDAIRKTRKDRKFCVFYTAQQEPEDMETSGMTGTYFPRLYEWGRAEGYAIINDFLRNYKIAQEFNPATDCHRAPETSSTPAVLIQSLGIVEQDVLEAISSARTGFTDGWISSMAFRGLLKELHVQIPIANIRNILKDLGYIPHPALTNGRVNNIIPIEGGKPVLYVKQTHPARSIRDASTVARVYQEAQGYILPRGGAGAPRMQAPGS